MSTGVDSVLSSRSLLAVSFQRRNQLSSPTEYLSCCRWFYSGRCALWWCSFEAYYLGRWLSWTNSAMSISLFLPPLDGERPSSHLLGIAWSHWFINDSWTIEHKGPRKRWLRSHLVNNDWQYKSSLSQLDLFFISLLSSCNNTNLR